LPAKKMCVCCLEWLVVVIVVSVVAVVVVAVVATEVATATTAEPTTSEANKNRLRSAAKPAKCKS